jgi:ribonuclease P protein component
MKYTVSLKNNYEFRRLYSKGESAVSPYEVVYCRKNGRGCNRVGYTVSTKLGKAVVRNRIRRRYKEIYRLNEDRLKCGYDIVVVARSKSRDAEFLKLETDFLRLCKKLGLCGDTI